MGQLFSQCKKSDPSLDETIEENKGEENRVLFSEQFVSSKKKDKIMRRATGAGGLLGKTPQVEDTTDELPLEENLAEAEKNANENINPQEEPRALSPTPAGGKVSAEEIAASEEQQVEAATEEQQAEAATEEQQTEAASSEETQEAAEEAAVEEATEQAAEEETAAEAVAEEAAPAEEAATEETAQEAETDAPAEVTEAAAEEAAEEAAVEETAAEAETAVEPAESQD
ncbi:Oidioi.mRNA.OKI2018_I69.chr1.g2898.t2.cds [Oikopleura dioica]|uniref:Oidioi.mRNA.OKI2018_I69.chr1.g2898.t2.cds n=1 Tax=Oikopleura dioica TaxID=34765 RepID=A0ABN7SWQ9_OIKDI|nr:Oidioi.mRNA.OKI2018_I69.chr1.g2898.t2.cds [Oikopleura dioica]